MDSRESKEGDSIRRRRECLACGKRFTSYERVEESTLTIIKKDGRREPFDREKLRRGMLAACQKRSVGLATIDAAVSEVHSRLLERGEREISSRIVGEVAMERLRTVDKVAYIRFASVYREFSDIPDFVHIFEAMMKTPPAQPRPVKLPGLE